MFIFNPSYGIISFSQQNPPGFWPLAPQLPHSLLLLLATRFSAACLPLPTDVCDNFCEQRILVSFHLFVLLPVFVFSCCLSCKVSAMLDTGSQKVRDFTEAAETAGLKDGMIRKLLDQDIDSPEDVAMLKEADFVDLQLSCGHMLVLRKWSRDLAADTANSASGEEPNLDSTPAEPSLDDLLVQLEGPENGVTEPTADYKTLGKPLFITDFINRATVGLSDTIEREVCHQGNAQLVLRAAQQKPLAD